MTEWKGKKVKDSISGFRGVLTARTEYINGCIQYEITPDDVVNGRIPPSVWMDEQRVEFLDPIKKIRAKKKSWQQGSNGGPASPPSRRSHPDSSHADVETY